MLAFEPHPAERIVRALFSGEAVPEIAEPLAIPDIERDVVSFKVDLEILSEIGRNAPALQLGDGEAVPVSLSYFSPQLPWESLQNATWSDFGDYPVSRDEFLSVTASVLNNIEERRSDEFVTISLEEAESTFLRRATEFLRTRGDAVNQYLQRRLSDPPWPRFAFLNVSQRSGKPPRRTPGCDFTVTTNSTGLSVYWSGAYFINPVYFGAPTSPTTGKLMTGIYLFGVKGGQYKKVKFDPETKVRLPGPPQVHLHL